MAAIAGPMRSAENRSKCSRDFQKSITPQLPSTGPDAWKMNDVNDDVRALPQADRDGSRPSRDEP
jgi:hypothetical protein